MGMLIFTLVALLLVVISVRERVVLKNMRDKNWDVIGEAKASPLSQAITGMVGTAGGIYLSLMLMQTFLEMDLPHTVQVGDIALEPLATFSIALAIIQPFALRFWSRRRYR